MIVTRKGRDARRIEPSGVPAEDFLQEYIAQNPEALPFFELRDELRLMVVVRELPTSSGPIDAVALDGEGNVYLIETKLYRNADKRKVLAQVMDYGAALWDASGGEGTFRKGLESVSRKSFDEPVTDRIAAFFGLDPETSDDLLDAADAQVTKGHMRFVVLMDRIDDALKNLISFINENSRFDVYGVELQFYRFDDYEVTIPRLYGAEARKEVDRGSSASQRRWGEASFFADAEECLSPDELQSVRKLYAFATSDATRIDWGNGLRPSFNPKFDLLGPRSPITTKSDGEMYLNFAGMKDAEGQTPPRVARVVELLLAIPSIGLPNTIADRYKLVKVESWSPHVDAIIAAFRNVLGDRSE